jgi:hypothetical protein
MRLLLVPVITDSVPIYLLQPPDNIIRYISAVNLHTHKWFFSETYLQYSHALFQPQGWNIQYTGRAQLLALDKFASTHKLSASMCTGVYWLKQSSVHPNSKQYSYLEKESYNKTQHCILLNTAHYLFFFVCEIYKIEFRKLSYKWHECWLFCSQKIKYEHMTHETKNYLEMRCSKYPQQK